jgi:hypothetical protein
LWFKALWGVVRRELHAVPVRIVNLSTECQPADKKVFLTPGLVLGSFPLGERLHRGIGAGMQIAVTTFQQYNHRGILWARFPFRAAVLDALNEYLQLHGSFCCPDVVHRFLETLSDRVEGVQ